MFRKNRRGNDEGLPQKHMVSTPSRTNKKPSSAFAKTFKCVTVVFAFLVVFFVFIDDNETSLSMSMPLSRSHSVVQDNGMLNPLFSLNPVTKSFHPKYKLWTEMNLSEQNVAMDLVGGYMKKYGKILSPPDKTRNQIQSLVHGDCEFDKDIGSTGHKVCGPAPKEACNFISFGINDDPSWDREIANKWGCRGYTGDPTVSLPSKIHPLVTFHNVGATVMQDNEERLINKGGEEEWWMTSFPKLRYFLGLEKIDILKIDCEGCEVSLSRDMLREDPLFLYHVDQISIETHVTKTWMTTTEHVYYFGLLLVLLEEAGFKMEWSSVFGCSKRHEITGCMPEFEKYGWPCGYDPWPGHPNVVYGRSCQEFTWKRY